MQYAQSPFSYKRTPQGCQLPTSEMLFVAVLGCFFVATLSGITPPADTNTLRTVYLPDGTKANIATPSKGSDVKVTIQKFNTTLFPEVSLIYLTNNVDGKYVNDLDTVNASVLSLKSDYVLKAKTPLKPPYSNFKVGANMKTTYNELGQMLAKAILDVSRKSIVNFTMTITPTKSGTQSISTQCQNAICPSGNLANVDFIKNATVTIAYS